jgi:nucleolar protein 56
MMEEFESIVGCLKIEGSKVVEAGDCSFGLQKSQDAKAALSYLKDKRYNAPFVRMNIEITKQQIRESVGEDLLVIQSIRVIDDLKHVTNLLVRRLREWYELYNPEFSRACEDHEKFIYRILKDRNKLKREGSMGADIPDDSRHAIYELAERIKGLYAEIESQEKYIEDVMKRICPNMLAITGALIGAQLLEHAGSMKQMSIMPASTIQLLGAEKALFKHLRTGAKCPKYGLIFNHPVVRDSAQRHKGKAARIVADKISIAVRIDHFKGEYRGEKLKAELDSKVERLR